MEDPADFIIGAGAIGLGFAAQFIPGVGQLVGAALFSFGAGKLAESSGLFDQQQGIVENPTATTERLPIVYGTAKVGGITSDLRADADLELSSAEEQVAIRLVAFAVGSENGAGIESVETIWFDEEVAVASPVFSDANADSMDVTDNPFRGSSLYRLERGSDDQLAAPLLTTYFSDSWDETGRGRGVAYLLMELSFDQEIFPGFPTAQLLVKGNRVYDPRDPTGGPDSDGFAWSNNPWLCLLDYLTSVRYGIDASYPERDGPKKTGSVTIGAEPSGETELLLSTGAGESLTLNKYDRFTIAGVDGIYTAQEDFSLGAASAARVTVAPGLDSATSGGEEITLIQFSEIDEQSFIDAANHADEMVPYTKSDGTVGSQKRHTFDGWLRTASQPEHHKQNISQLVQSTGGMLVHQSGQWRAVPKRPTASVDYELNPDNILGDWSGRRSGIQDAPSRVRADYVDADRSYSAQSIHWPETNAANSYRDEDAGFPSTLSLDLPGVTDRARAQRMAQVALKEARADKTFTLRADESALQLQVGDVVPLRHPTPGYTTDNGYPDGKLFWVDKQEIYFEDESLQVGLILREYDADAYVSELGSPPDDVPDPVLPDPRESPLANDLVHYIPVSLTGIGACGNECLCDSSDPRRKQYDVSGYNNHGVIGKAGGFNWGDVCPSPGVEGISFDNAEGGALITVSNSHLATELQLANAASGDGFTAMGWFYSNSDLVNTASFGQQDDVNKEGWSADIDSDGDRAGFSFWGTDGNQKGKGVDISPSIDPNEWCHYAVVVNPTDASGNFSVRFYVNGQFQGAKTFSKGPITPTTTSKEFGWGAEVGGNPNITRISGRMQHLMLWNGTLSGSQIRDLFEDPGSMQSPTQFENLDDIPDGDFAKVDGGFVDDDGRPRDYIDEIKIQVETNDTCAGGSGLSVEIEPTIAGLSQGDEGDWRVYVEWYEDGTFVEKETTTNIWTVAGGEATYDYQDGTTGSDASDAASHTIRAHMVLVDISGTDDKAVDSKSASITATYGTSCP